MNDFVATEYTLYVVPRGHYLRTRWEYDDCDTYVVRVVFRDEGRWAVTDGFGQVFSKTLCRRHEPSPSNRSDHFKSVYRHDLDTAFAIGRKVAAEKLKWLESKWPCT